MQNGYSEGSLKAAVAKADSLLIDSLPSDNQISHVFSKRFERRMKKLLRVSRQPEKAKWNMRFSQKRWIAILAAIIMAFSMALSVSAVRQSIYQFISQVYEKYTDIFFKSTSTSSLTESAVIKTQIPSYIPDGFQLTHRDDNNMVLLEYEKEKDFISYQQEPLENVSARINTEGVETEETKINGLQAIYYSNQGVQNLIWYDDKYLYTVSSTLGRETVFRIAESVPLDKP